MSLSLLVLGSKPISDVLVAAPPALLRSQLNPPLPPGSRIIPLLIWGLTIGRCKEINGNKNL